MQSLQALRPITSAQIHKRLNPIRVLLGSQFLPASSAADFAKTQRPRGRWQEREVRAIVTRLLNLGFFAGKGALMSDQSQTPSTHTFEAPHPGSQDMPRWTTAELIDAPKFTKQNLLAMIGPGLVMGASAIGGGEWLAGQERC